MPGEELYVNGVGRTQAIYQQPSTGEKHVLFYPTSPAPSATSEERRSWSQGSGNQNLSNHKGASNNNSSATLKRMKRSNEGPSGDPVDPGEQNNDILDSGQAKFRIGIYGWRKRCLYCLILALLVIVVVNLGLTLWVLKVMEFSSEGMGQLKIVAGGLRLEGKAFVLDSLIASSIKSRTGQPIVLESSRNLTLSSRSKEGLIDNYMFLGNDRLECLANSFRILDDRGTPVFSADDREITIGAHTLSVSGEGGTSFEGSIQTTLLRAHSGNDLRLESPTRSLHLHASQDVRLESRGGRVRVLSLGDLTLRSEVGAVKLDSSSVLMPTLPTALPASNTRSSTKSSQGTQQVFQLCVCDNGMLFLSPAHEICASDGDGVMCR